MRKSDRALSAAPVIAGAILIALMGLTLALAGQIGVWLVAIVGGAILGILVALAAVGIARVNKTARLRDHSSLIDPVTLLPNADMLLVDLERALAAPDDHERVVFSLYLLDGVKQYNDAYGRGCGDVLLRWLGGKLRSEVGERGTAYRMRGGEFAVLSRGDEAATAQVLADAAAALCERGEGFVVTSSAGEAVLHEEAESIAEALKLADHRAQTDRAHTVGAESTQQPPQDATAATSPRVSRIDVAALATAVAAAIEYPPERIDDLAAAARMRDVGTIAVPATILAPDRHLAPAPAESDFVRLHTLVGERLLAARFGMEDVARLVRSSHERWDGGGYPDGLQADEIPLGSRIVSVCSAFESMTSTGPALDVDPALAELEREAGVQFDPLVVRAVRAVLTGQANQHLIAHANR
jgi:diguanylate cyclase (GGDEF)-like protein